MPRHALRTAPCLLLPLLAAAPAAACSCFTPEMREKAARETLATAQTVVFGRIAAPRADGSGELVVAESFKGPAKGAVVAIQPGPATCPPQAAVLDQEVLVIAYQAPVTVCEKYPQDHFLLEFFRTKKAP
jgi:hypothetical protein